jgi:hypothetical protein
MSEMFLPSPLLLDAESSELEHPLRAVVSAKATATASTAFLLILISPASPFHYT